MTPERRAYLISWGSGIVALLLIWGTFPFFRASLPDPLATHWSSSNLPNGSQGHLMFLGFASGLVIIQFIIVLCLNLYSASAKAAGEENAIDSRFVTSFSLGWATFAASVYFSLIYVNHGLNHWSEAGSPLPGVLTALAASIAAATLGWFLGVAANRKAVDPAEAFPLEAGERLTWSGSISSVWLPVVVAISLISSIVLVYASLGFTLAAHLIFVSLLPVLAFGTLILGSVSVSVGKVGVVIRFGVVGWPRWVIPLDDIEQASAQERHGSEVGGWGFRFYSGGKAVMLRSGQCLVLQRKGSLGEVTISIDDAQTAASTISTLQQAPQNS
ncbi:hypothetical protein [Natronoglycomyces albus]|uniref:DUF1648 domain-containing protein n=1 Tax=Natronoglycomyces albus TaxID=2811108 RepID=A0A895XLI8_9ACTN|nr:hypothetical protein [Natronoglycomyces albus]QSB04413.1 hypothetical protein JQS30_11495 [Natronoglycomyces albus]